MRAVLVVILALTAFGSALADLHVLIGFEPSTPDEMYEVSACAEEQLVNADPTTLLWFDVPCGSGTVVVVRVTHTGIDGEVEGGRPRSGGCACIRF